MSTFTSAPTTDDSDEVVVEEPDFLRARIREANDIPLRLFHSDAWGVDIEIRGMTGAERAKYLAAMNVKGDKIDWKAIAPIILIACCWAPAKKASDGTWMPGKSTRKLFKVDDAPLILAKAGAETERLTRLCSKLSGIGGEDVADAEDDAQAPTPA